MPTKAYGRMVFWEGASLWVLGTRPGEGPYPKTDFHIPPRRPGDAVTARMVHAGESRPTG